MNPANVHEPEDRVREHLGDARPVEKHPETDATRAELDATGCADAPDGFPPAGSVPVSVLIPVLNEEKNIVECVRRVRWAAEITVIDSGSRDGTVPLSQALGADVYHFNYDRSRGWPKKKNWALSHVPWRNEWVLILDADEHMTPELAAEIERVVTGKWAPNDPSKAGCGDGFWLNRRFMFMGRWLRGCGYYPSWNIRLLRHKAGRYERIGGLGDTGSGDNEVHEHVVLSTGEAGYLQHDFLHYAYPDLATWIEKHNRYSTWEAHAAKAGDRGEIHPRLFGQPIERRRWLKSAARRLPLRPTLRFIYSYFIQRGFLDGYPGFVMCRLLAWYEAVSIAKERELDLIPADAPQLAPARPARPPKAPPMRTVTSHTAPARSGREAITHANSTALPRPPVSVVVLTFNEEQNIRPCLESCSWADDVHILDSGSTDRTVDIAREFGAKVWTNPFHGFGQQRNWGIDNIPCAHRWQFHLDADERFTPELVREIASIIRDDGAAVPESCFHCPSMLMFMGRWLRYASEYPVYQVRLIDRTRCRFEDYGHGQREVTEGSAGTLSEPYLHYNFSKGVDEWFEKHNRYSRLEAVHAHRASDQSIVSLIGSALRGDAVQRRRSLKQLSYRVPARSSLLWLYHTLVKRGILDGPAGLAYIRMRRVYEDMIGVKMSILRHGSNSYEGRRMLSDSPAPKPEARSDD